MVIDYDSNVDGVIYIRIPKAVREAIIELARKHNTKMSVIARKLIAVGLKEELNVTGANK